jgi:hypothetical protein
VTGHDNMFSDMNISYVLRFSMVVNNIICDLCFPQSWKENYEK